MTQFVATPAEVLAQHEEDGPLLRRGPALKRRHPFRRVTFIASWAGEKESCLLCPLRCEPIALAPPLWPRARRGASPCLRVGSAGAGAPHGARHRRSRRGRLDPPGPPRVAVCCSKGMVRHRSMCNATRPLDHHAQKYSQICRTVGVRHPSFCPARCSQDVRTTLH